jgi:hypothetical protein
MVDCVDYFIGAVDYALRRAPGAALPRARNVAKRRAEAGLPIFLFFAGRPVTC